MRILDSSVDQTVVWRVPRELRFAGGRSRYALESVHRESARRVFAPSDALLPGARGRTALSDSIGKNARRHTAASGRGRTAPGDALLPGARERTALSDIRDERARPLVTVGGCEKQHQAASGCRDGRRRTAFDENRRLLATRPPCRGDVKGTH